MPEVSNTTQVGQHGLGRYFLGVSPKVTGASVLEEYGRLVIRVCTVRTVTGVSSVVYPQLRGGALLLPIGLRAGSCTGLLLRCW